jgi:hypothetical protein
MKITISMQTGNEAFQNDNDIAKALIELAKRIKRSGIDNISKIMDSNGNSVGTVDFTK